MLSMFAILLIGSSTTKFYISSLINSLYLIEPENQTMNIKKTNKIQWKSRVLDIGIREETKLDMNIDSKNSKAFISKNDDNFDIRNSR